MPIDDVLAVKRRLGVTLNDVCLAMAAGALRELALARGESPAAAQGDGAGERARRTGDERLARQPHLVRLHRPAARHRERRSGRLARLHTATAAFKRGGKPAGAETVLGALGLLPEPLRNVAARAVASPRLYNLTISNIPGPRVPVYMLGAELDRAHIRWCRSPEGHALSIGIFSHCERLGFGLYADPDAFPQVDDLPQALDTSLRELLLPRAVKRTGGRPRGRGRPLDSPVLVAG